MKNLIIIGASGCGRDTYELAISTHEYQKSFIIKGFLDSRKHILDEYKNYPKVLCSVEDYVIQEDDVFVCAQGDSPAREKFTKRIQEKGGVFITLISPLAVVNKNAKIGNGCIICRYANIGADAVLENNVRIQAFSNIGHDSHIQDFATLQCYAFTGGFSEVGAGATLCTGAKLLPHKKIGTNAFVGAGSVVFQNIEAEKHVFGVPAKQISEESKAEISSIKISDIENLFELPTGTLKEDTKLKDLECYDSIAKMELLNFLEEHNKTVSIDSIHLLRTVKDVLSV